MSQHHSFRDFDWAVIVLSLAICSLGVLQIFSATHDTPVWRDAWWKQAVWVGLGLVLMWGVTRVDYHTLISQSPLFYGLTLAALTLTFVGGKTVFGSRRWILIGPLRFQVSEFAKLVIVLLVARYLAQVKDNRLDARGLLKLCGLVLVPMLMVMAQPDLGTSLTYVPVLAMGILLVGLQWKHVVVIAAAAAVLAPIGYFSLKDYQKQRLETFIDPANDPRGAGYQVIQSKIAVGQGGMWGQGVTKGTQTQLRFLPVPHTDFIFSTFAEEHGFVGVVVVLGMYFLLLMQIVQNGQTATDRAGMYVCMGVAALLLFHVMVNVGMVVGRMPVTGIPLPLMSSGGSNILSMFMMLGLVQNVRLRRFLN